MPGITFIMLLGDRKKTVRVEQFTYLRIIITDILLKKPLGIISQQLVDDDYGENGQRPGEKFYPLAFERLLIAMIAYVID